MNTIQRWRVVEFGFFGALAQTAAMSTAVISFYLLGAGWATATLLLAAVAIYVLDHSPTAMSSIAGIPVVWLCHAITTPSWWPYIPHLTILIVAVDYTAAWVTNKKEPMIRITARFAWQLLVSLVVQATCLLATGHSNIFLGLILVVGSTMIWSWALIVQPRGTNIFGWPTKRKPAQL